VTGRLLNAQGLPIAGASLDVLQQVDGATLELIGRARTGSDGMFVASVPGGPSRTVEIAYRAFSTDTGYAAVAKLAESVDAGVQLGVSPRRTGSEGEITLSGRVLGPVPSQGVVVELLVHYRGHWEPFRDPRTDSRGRFRVAYRFQGGIGRFPFRAVVFGSQGGFPFAPGESRAVDVTTK
jgi:5-hydroxyisourate hydrolase-like protein (transthyretin family)